MVNDCAQDRQNHEKLLKEFPESTMESMGFAALAQGVHGDALHRVFFDEAESECVWDMAVRWLCAFGLHGCGCRNPKGTGE